MEIDSLLAKILLSLEIRSPEFGEGSIFSFKDTDTFSKQP
jgi:hypothetical protein